MSLPGKHDGQHAHQGNSTRTVYKMLAPVYILCTLLRDDPVPSIDDHYQLKLPAYTQSYQAFLDNFLSLYEAPRIEVS